MRREGRDKRGLKLAAGRLVLIGAVLILWELLIRWGLMEEELISLPTAIMGALIEWVRDGTLTSHLYITILEMVAGFASGIFLGIAVGLIFALSDRLARIFDPLMVLLNSMPRVVLTPLFILAFGLGLLSKVALIITMVFFPVFFNTLSGLKSIERDLIDNVLLLGASKVDLIRHLYLPSALVWIFASLRVSVGYALMGAIIGEYMGSLKGLGNVILLAQASFQINKVMAGLTVLAIMVAILDAALRRVERRYSLWKLEAI